MIPTLHPHHLRHIEWHIRRCDRQGRFPIEAHAGLVRVGNSNLEPEQARRLAADLWRMAGRADVQLREIEELTRCEGR